MNSILAVLAAFAAEAMSVGASGGVTQTASARALPSATQHVWATHEGDVILRDFRFHDGETIAQLRIHYRTLGSPHHDASGKIDNAVMVLHGTGGDGAQFLRPQFADELYGPGQPLDIRKYWIILPDNIGHGKSSKPSDGARMRFPRYDYDDMVEAQRRMLSEGLDVRQLRLIMGTSMGCMHAFIWGEKYPTFSRALMPLACEPIEIAGLNRMWRQMIIDAIENDPGWKGGNYDHEPQQGLRTAESILFIAGSAPLYLQAHYAKRTAATALVEESVTRGMTGLDANDTLYQFDSSRDYNPWPMLEKITAPLMWVNSADDFINPRNLGIPAQALRRMKNARYRMIPETSETHGHGTHTWAKFWKADLIALLARS